MQPIHVGNYSLSKDELIKIYLEVDGDLDIWKDRIKVAAGSIEQIDELREAFEQVSALCEARLRVLVRGSVLPDEWLDPPVWLDSEIEAANDANIGTRTIESAKRLSLSLLADHSTLEAEWNFVPGGVIEVTWYAQSELIWAVKPPQLPWPGVNVRAYACEPADLQYLRPRSFWVAQRVIRHARKVLSNDGG